jgi:lysophospholipase L1-like esterase
MDVRKTAKNIGISLFMSLVLLLLIEGFIRVFFHSVQPQDCDSKIIVDNAYRSSCGLKPNASGMFFGHVLHSDTLGGRKMRKSFSKKKKTWLHLGDSVTMGVGVDDDSTFVSRMAEHIDSVNMLNLSLIGYSVGDYENVIHSLLIEEHNELKIERISLYWCLNDIYNIPLGHSPSKLDKAKDYIRSNYLTYVFLKGLFFDRGKFYYEHEAAYYVPSRTEFRQSVQILGKIQEMCESQGVQLDISILPYEYQYRLPKQDFALQQLMIKGLAQEGVNQVNDMSPAFLAKAKESRILYLFGDGIHFSNQGHARMAHYLLYGN